MPVRLSDCVDEGGDWRCGEEEEKQQPATIARGSVLPSGADEGVAQRVSSSQEETQRHVLRVSLPAVFSSTSSSRALIRRASPPRGHFAPVAESKAE